MRYKASITSGLLCVALSIIVLHVIWSFMNLFIEAKKKKIEKTTKNDGTSNSVRKDMHMQ